MWRLLGDQFHLEEFVRGCLSSSPFSRGWFTWRWFSFRWTGNPWYGAGIRSTALHSYPKQSLYWSNVNRSYVKTLQQWITVRNGWMDGSSYGDCKFWTTSPSATLVTSKRHLLFNSVQVYYYFLNAFSVERLTSGRSLYYLISNYLHRN